MSRPVVRRLHVSPDGWVCGARVRRHISWWHVAGMAVCLASTAFSLVVIWWLT